MRQTVEYPWCNVTLLVGLRRCVTAAITVCMSSRRPAFSFRTGDFKIAAFPAARDRPEKREAKRDSLVVWNHDVAIVDAQVGRCGVSVCRSRPVVERGTNLECVL